MPKTVAFRSGQIEFLKINADRRDWRDSYNWVLSLGWLSFLLLIAGVYVGVNIFFALLYTIEGGAIAGMTPGSFPQAFFFSVQTLATVGYGHMYPQTVYGHVITTVEIISGMFWIALMTGLIFVRFSRPTARIMFSRSMVIGPFNGRPALMLRVANMRHHSMVEAEFRLLFTREEPVLEGGTVRRFYPLKLEFDRAIVFPAALTLRHFIDESSPLFGETRDSLQAKDAFFLSSVVCIETIIPAAVQANWDYSWDNVLFGQRFVEIYEDLPDGRLKVDYGRLHDTEAATSSPT